MFVKRLILQNYRNYEHLDISFPLKRIYITGNNGIGKTNVLEAIHYMSMGRSFRKADDPDLVQKGFSQASIYLEFYSEKDEKDHTLSCILSKERKIFAYDGEKVKSLSSILGKLIDVYYEPNLVFFFRAEPEQRRKLLDETCSQLSSQYLYAISRYKKLLKERNAALQRNCDSDVILAYRNQLINLSYRIVKDRKDIIKSLSKKTEENYNSLFQEENRFFTLGYKTSCPIDDDQESYVKNAIQLFENAKSYENIRKTTLIGPHRDDLIGFLNGNPISEYGSQGENRIASLSLKLSTLDLFSQRLNTRPILLLDDITSDLDEKRCLNLLSCINKENQQVFITGTRIPEGFLDYQIYTSDGKTLSQKGKEE